MSAWLAYVEAAAKEAREKDEANGIDWERDGLPKGAQFMVCVRRTRILFKKIKKKVEKNYNLLKTKRI